MTIAILIASLMKNERVNIIKTSSRLYITQTKAIWEVCYEN